MSTASRLHHAALTAAHHMQRWHALVAWRIRRRWWPDIPRPTSSVTLNGRTQAQVYLFDDAGVAWLRQSDNQIVVTQNRRRRAVIAYRVLNGKIEILSEFEDGSPAGASALALMRAAVADANARPRFSARA